MRSRSSFCYVCVTAVSLLSLACVQRNVTGIRWPHLWHSGVDAARTTATSTLAPHDPEQPYRFAEDVAVVAWQNVTYRYPSSVFANLASGGNNDELGIITGVLSASKVATCQERRNWIRSTWAYNRTDVFFLLAGEWETVQEEFHIHGDIMWVAKEEAYTQITWKVQTFFSAIHKHISNCRHVLKTDDDSYVNMGEIQRVSRAEHRKADYVGLCMDGMGQGDNLLETYPTYASGGGYMLSQSLVACFADAMSTSLGIATEDAFSGILARACGANCTTEKRIYPWREQDGVLHERKDFLIQHYVRNKDEMMYLHGLACSGNRSAQEASCGPGSEKAKHLTLTTDCGGHSARACGECPQGHGKEWCHTDCQWCEHGTTGNSTSTSTRALSEADRCVPMLDTCKTAKRGGGQGNPAKRRA